LVVKAPIIVIVSQAEYSYALNQSKSEKQNERTSYLLSLRI
jgi:hypothetical protein